MNSKFFDVKKSKQDSIINAALKVFATNGYRKASTDVIVQEAGISKGLLFHYFISKKGLYEFIYDYSVKYMTLELTQSVKRMEKDFFEVQKMIETAKFRVMRNYPYMQQFLDSVKFETHPDALEAMGEQKDVMTSVYYNVYCQTDNTKFMEHVDVTRVIQMISWMSEGFIKEAFRTPNPDLEQMSEEFGKYLTMLKAHFYKGRPTSVIDTEVVDDGYDRDERVMENMRMEQTFEERLLAGKRPLVDTPKEDEAEIDVTDAESDKAESGAAESDVVEADAAESIVVEADAAENDTASLTQGGFTYTYGTPWVKTGDVSVNLNPQTRIINTYSVIGE